jgi:undecaprenyl-diphosphatase
MKTRLFIIIIVAITAGLTAHSLAWTPSAVQDDPSVDEKIFRFLNGSIINPVFDAIMPVVTDFRRWRIVLILVWSALVLFGGTKGRWAAFMLIPLVAASDQITSHLIKPAVRRIRPCEILGSIHLWYGPEGWITTPAEVVRSYKPSFSFPSSHAANITASMLFLGIALLVSFSRIYIGVHWPSDVAVGMLIGALLAWPATVVFKHIYREPTDGELRQ